MSDGDHLLTAYDRQGHWCEMLGGDGLSAGHTTRARERLGALSLSDLVHRAEVAGRELYNLGITFAVYSERDLIGGGSSELHQPTDDQNVGVPTLIDGTSEPRHADLRPFVVTGRSSWVLPGGLTRVVLCGSLIVISSQGGGSKDAWVLDP